MSLDDVQRMVLELLSDFTWVNVLVAIAILGFGIPLAVWTHDNYRLRKCPPGPPTRPFIGNKHLIPASRPWLKMAEWSETYVFLNRLGMLMAGPNIHFMARKESDYRH